MEDWDVMRMPADGGGLCGTEPHDPAGLPGLSRSQTRRLWRALIEFQMVREGDRILVGFSGGKDSAFLLYGLSMIRRYSPIRFDLAAATVDQGFGLVGDARAARDAPEPMGRFAAQVGVPYFVMPTNIAQVAFAPNCKENPCAICSHLRRGALNRCAVEHGFNKVALAHHRDDVVETFLMSILYSGQIATFRPVTFLDRTGLTVIRPLVYFRESEIAGAVRRLGYEPPRNECPMAGKTHRARVKELIRSLSRENRMVYHNLFKALHADAVRELWPPVASEREMRERHEALFGKVARGPTRNGRDGDPGVGAGGT